MINRSDSEIRNRLIDLLLQAGIDPNYKNRFGETPLLHAVENCDIKLTEKLLKAGANPNTPDSRGATPLRAAHDRGNSDIVLLLQRHNAH